MMKGVVFNAWVNRKYTTPDVSCLQVAASIISPCIKKDKNLS